MDQEWSKLLNSKKGSKKSRTVKAAEISPKSVDSSDTGKILEKLFHLVKMLAGLPTRVFRWIKTLNKLTSVQNRWY